MKHNHEPDEKDEWGIIDIPSKTDFWLVMMDGTIYLLNSRRSVITRVIQQFNIKAITIRNQL